MMSWFGNLSIRNKLLLTFATIIILSVFMGLFSNYQMKKVFRSADMIADDNLPSISGLLELDEQLAEITRHWFEHILSTSSVDMENGEKDLEQHVKTFRQRHKALVNVMNTPEEKQKYAELAAVANRCFDIHKKIILLSKNGKKTEAFQVYRTEGKSDCDRAGELIDALAAINKREAAEQIILAESRFTYSYVANYLLIGAIVVTSLLLAFGAARAITRPVAHAVATAHRIAGGDFDVAIDVTTQDEVGELLRAMAAMATSLDARDRLIGQQSASILELSTPVIQLTGNVLLLPLVGLIDTSRARQFTDRLLQAIVTHESPVAVIDVTGVPTFDTTVARHIMNAIDATQLLGTHVVITGISPEAATTLTELGIRFEQSTCCGTLRAGVVEALRRVGCRIERNEGAA